MTEDDAATQRCWLVERTFDDRNLVTLVYATPDGERYQRRERSANSLRAGNAPTAAVDLDPAELEPVDDPDTIDRYATEANRVANTRAPDEQL